jgi:hypothetical protein
MLDPRLQYAQLHARQQELAERAARDRLAASQHTERHALGNLLTAAGTALLALGTRLRGQKVPAWPYLADAVPSSDQRHSEASGHSARWIIVRQQDDSAAIGSTRVALNRDPTASEECS